MTALLEAGAQIDRQDRNQWTALMWAITNRHKDIAKILLDHGASPDVKSSSGRTAFDFAAPHSEMANYLQESGYHMGDTGIGDDFYDSGFSQDRFEQEMEENEMKRRMMMESSRDLEVDLSSLGMDERPEVAIQVAYYLSLLTSCRRLMTSTKLSNKNSFGTGVSMTRCSSFKRASWTVYSISSSRI